MLGKGFSMRIFRVVVLVLTAAFLSAPLAIAQSAPPPDRAQIEAIHNDLRGVLARLVEAVNKKNIDALMQEVTSDVAFTAINNDTVLGADKVKPYFDRMLSGASSFLNDFSIKAEADQLSKLYAGNQMAVATGNAVGNFDLRGGDQMKFTVPMRWTATLDGTSGKWKLAAIHFSADFAHNPYVSAVSSFWKWVAIALTIVGLAVGYFIGRRRRGARA